MVVDLGSVQDLDTLTLHWIGRRIPTVTVSVSTDGTTFQPVTGGRQGQPIATIPLTTQARYVAVTAPNRQTDGDAGLASLSITT
jgi:hypothetical protein